MAVVRPVAWYGGRYEQVRDGDTLYGAAAGSAAVPTVVPAAGSMTLAANTQTLFKVPIVLGAGAVILGQAGAVLAGVC